ncbi:MAG: energy transducer TonB [Mucilaginibacter sp.]
MKHLILLTCFLGLLAYRASAQTSSADTVVWGSVQTNFPGGQEAYNTYVSDSLKYPLMALNNHVMGCTYMRFTIEKDGTLSDVKVFRGVGSGMDEAAVHFIRNSGKWTPSTVNGKPVRTRCKVAENYIMKENHNHELYGTVSGMPSNPAYLAGAEY